MRRFFLALLLACACGGGGSGEEGAACTNTNQCATGLLCFSECLSPPCPSAQCHKTCSVNADCAPGQRCERFCRAD